MLQKLSDLFARWADMLDPQPISTFKIDAANKEIINLRRLETEIASGKYGTICSATQEEIRKVHLVCEAVTDAFAARSAGRGPDIYEDPANAIREQVTALRAYAKTAPESERGFISNSADLYESVHIISFDFGDHKNKVTRRGFLGMKR